MWFVFLCSLWLEAEKGSPPGLIVERVAADSAAARGGLESGNDLVAWTRNDAPAGAAALASVFDLIELEIQHATRAPFVLQGQRAGAQTSWTLPPTVLGLEVRPPLGDSLLALHREAAALQADKKPGEAGERLRAAAAEARRLGDEPLASWFEARSAN